MQYLWSDDFIAFPLAKLCSALWCKNYNQARFLVGVIYCRNFCVIWEYKNIPDFALNSMLLADALGWEQGCAHRHLKQLEKEHWEDTVFTLLPKYHFSLKLAFFNVLCFTSEVQLSSHFHYCFIPLFSLPFWFVSLSFSKAVCRLPSLGQQKNENALFVHTKAWASIAPFLPLLKKVQFCLPSYRDLCYVYCSLALIFIVLSDLNVLPSLNIDML